MCYFSTLKMLPLALALIKTKNRHRLLLDQLIGQKLPILHEQLEFWMTRDNFPLKKRGFWAMGQLFWSTPEPMVTFFRVKKSHLLKMRFFRHPVHTTTCHTPYILSSNLFIPKYIRVLIHEITSCSLYCYP